MLAGFATAEGTARYAVRFPALRDAGHFRNRSHVPGAGELAISSIGFGTYLGDTTEAADRSYTTAIVQSLRSGVNLLDTAINYRHQRSERNIGAALEQLAAAGELRRDEVLVCTKAGYLAFDGQLPADPGSYFRREYVEPGILDPAQVAAGSHCMAPRYLEDQIERSRRNLGLETLDLFYVHNPETQLSEVPRPVFQQRLRDAFHLLERLVRAGKLRWYGVATWNAFRLGPDDDRGLGLEEVVGMAREAGGDAHHCRFVQLPFNLAMLEAYALSNQGPRQHPVSLLEAAARLGVAVVGSATLYQGQLTGGLPPAIAQRLGTANDAHTAIQFARSAPGLLCALVGMGQSEHVTQNLQVAMLPPTPREQWESLFQKQ